MVVESRQLVALSLTLPLTAERVHTGRREHLEQQQAQPVAHLWEGQGRCSTGAMRTRACPARALSLPNGHVTFMAYTLINVRRFCRAENVQPGIYLSCTRFGEGLL